MRRQTWIGLIVLPPLLGCGLYSFHGAPAYDFADDFYRLNGIEPREIVDRLRAQDGRSTFDRAPEREFADVRIREVTGGFDHEGNVLYYVTAGQVSPGTFTFDTRGTEARTIANDFRAYIFPKATGHPRGTAVSNRRQDNVFDTRRGYFDDNPLGLWLLVFVQYTEKALNTNAGRAMLADLTARNGRDLDGTAVIRTIAEIELLHQLGYVKLRTRSHTGLQGPPWVI